MTLKHMITDYNAREKYFDRLNRFSEVNVISMYLERIRTTIYCFFLKIISKFTNVF
jgi:hypothetical protein